jgi:hypothetical protein
MMKLSFSSTFFSYALALAIIMPVMPIFADNGTQLGDKDIPDQSLTLPDYPPLETFEEISKRPLFTSTRRPKPKADQFAENVTQKELMEKWRLVGVILNNETPLALMSEKQGDKRMTLAVGMPLDQTWVVSEIGSDFVVLDGSEDQARLELWQPRDKKATRKSRRPRTNGNNEQSSGQAQKAKTNAKPQSVPGAQIRIPPRDNNGSSGG